MVAIADVVEVLEEDAGVVSVHVAISIAGATVVVADTEEVEEVVAGDVTICDSIAGARVAVADAGVEVEHV